MNWNQLISAKRFGMEEFHEERQENRSEFQRDYDRLIFSAPFRRLQNKTQVFPLPWETLLSVIPANGPYPPSSPRGKVCA